MLFIDWEYGEVMAEIHLSLTGTVRTFSYGSQNICSAPSDTFKSTEREPCMKGRQDRQF
jgi:hypothetical protein